MPKIWLTFFTMFGIFKGSIENRVLTILFVSKLTKKEAMTFVLLIETNKKSVDEKKGY